MSDLFGKFIDLIISGFDKEIENEFKIEYLEMRNDNLCGRTPLHYACWYGRVELVKILIDNKCDISAFDEGGYQPIHFACEKGHIKIVKILIDNKCDINASNNVGYKPIHLACWNGHIDVLKILIDNKCDINASDNMAGYQPIHLACKNGQIKIVKILIDNKCNPKALAKYGESPIDIARKKGHQQIIDIIINSDPIECIVRAMNLQCTINCDHKFCRETLKHEKLPEGKLIGKGSFGKAYKYKTSNTNREFVIKQIEDFGEDKKNIERNINKFSSQIIHKNIVRHFGALEKSGKFYIFMEYISGGSLKDLIDKAGMIEINKVIQYSKQILVGLQFLHSKTILHRDIKPANILLDRDETVKLSDFGISRSLKKTFSQSVDKAGTYCGTPNYLAPEILIGVPYDYPADIWSTGATVIHMITGNMPYHQLRPEAVIFKIGISMKIEFSPSQPMSKPMKSFIEKLLTANQLERPTAECLLNHSLFDNLR